MNNQRRSLPIAITLFALAFGLSLFVGKSLGHRAGSSSALPSLLSSTMLIVVSLALGACFGESRWKELGLVRPAGRWRRFVVVALVVGMVVSFSIKLSPGEGMGKALRGLSVPVVLIIVIFGSLAEELFTRGWFQGFLEPHRDRLLHGAGLTMSVPVLASGLAFGAMHLTLVGKGVDAWTIGFILVFTTTVGLIAAKAREETGSLLPPVLIHLAGNAGGVLGGIVYVLMYAAVFGHVPKM